MTTRTPTNAIAIVGGGLGGVILAIALTRRGVPFHIYEAAASFGELGFGVALGPNSIRALSLISPALLAACARHATWNENPGLRDVFLTFRRGTVAGQDEGGGVAGDMLFYMRGRLPDRGIGEGREGANAGESSNMPVRVSVHRARFLDELVAMLPPGSATFGKALVGIEEPDVDKGQDIRLRFADGSVAQAAAVVGCDGIRSATRMYLHGKGTAPSFTGAYAYRGLIPRQDCEAAVGHERTTNGQMYLGKNGYIITYPVEHGASINMVAVRYRYPDGSAVGDSWPHDTWQTPTSLEDIRQDMTGWDPKLVDLLVRFGSGERWANFDVLHDEKYCRGRICLLGDSAHATTPHLGAGAGMAMEDAYVLSSLLEPGQSLGDVASAFEAFDRVRRPRSQELVRLSRLSGKTYAFMEEAVGGDLTKMEQVFIERYTWLWEEDLQQQVAVAKGAMANSPNPTR